MKKKTYDDYDENIDFDSLEQHTYADTPGQIFYTCPKCGGEYLGSLMTEEGGEAMCIECWNRLYGDDD